MSVRLLIVISIACTGAIVRAACDPHPMERLQLRSETSALLGKDSCELRAESATTATLRCAEHTYHLTWVAP
jgi:hypothetical protein